jgi:hypothetical protein
LGDWDNLDGIAELVVGFQPSLEEEVHIRFGRFDKKVGGSTVALARILSKVVLMASLLDRQLTLSKQCSKNSSWIL